MPSCAESTRLMSEALERPLTRGERLALRWHLLLCAGCRRFERQLDWLRRASGRYAPLDLDAGPSGAGDEPGSRVPR